MKIVSQGKKQNPEHSTEGSNPVFVVQQHQGESRVEAAALSAALTPLIAA